MVSLLLDECVPQSVHESLVNAGYDTARPKKGISDPEVLEDAKSQNRTVVTFDRGFANTIKYPPANFAGIILMRRKGKLSASDVVVLTTRLLEYLQDESSLGGDLHIVERSKVRRHRAVAGITHRKKASLPSVTLTKSKKKDTI